MHLCTPQSKCVHTFKTWIKMAQIIGDKHFYNWDLWITNRICDESDFE